jgi:hydrogenase small subunit
MLVGSYGKLIRSLRAITNNVVNQEPKWRHRGGELTTGYEPIHYGNGETDTTNESHPQFTRIE